MKREELKNEILLILDKHCVDEPTAKDLQELAEMLAEVVFDYVEKHRERKMEPKASYDRVADVLYIKLSDEPADKAIEIGHRVVVRYAKGVPVGVTVMDKVTFRYDDG